MSSYAICPECRARQAMPVGVKLPRMLGLLMEALAARPGQVVRHEALIDAVWGEDPDGGPDDAKHALHSHMEVLRRRLRRAAFPGRIKTAWGVGYALESAA